MTDHPSLLLIIIKNALPIGTNWLYLLYNLKQKSMTTSDIRAEIVELINSGILNIPKIVKYFRQYRPEANLEKVKEEAKELVAQVRETNKRGY